MEHLLLVNRRKIRHRNRRRATHKRRLRNRRRGRMPPGLARYWATHRRGHSRRRLTNPRRSRRRKNRRSHMARRRRRRLHNPRRHHAHRRHHNRHHRRRHLRNPRSGGSRVTLNNLMREAVVPAAIGGTGALVLDVVMGYLNPYLPTQLQSGWFNLLAKGAAAVGLGMVAGKFLGRSRGHVVMIGALTVTAYSAIRSATAGMGIPGLSGYADYTPYPMGRLGYINPGAVIAPTMTPGLGAYMRRATGAPPAPGTFSGVGAYMPMNVASAAPDFGDGM